MPYTVYRVELDGSETVIGCTDNWAEAVQIIDADKDVIDYNAGYHWVHDSNETVGNNE